MSISLISDYKCCITLAVMNEAVQAPCGHCFEKSAILEWLTLKSTCPIDRSLLKKEDLTINKELRKKIAGFLKEHPEFREVPPKESFLNRMKKVVKGFMKSGNHSAASYHRPLPCPLPIFPAYHKALGFRAFSYSE